MYYLVLVKPQEQKEPPIKVDSTLSVAWELTLILSRGAILLLITLLSGISFAPVIYVGASVQLQQQQQP
jgi:hypothetical protein